MNDSNSELDAFEQQLRRLQPAQPPDDLMTRLENPHSPRRASSGINFRAFVRFFVFGPGGATALLVIFAGWVIIHHGLHRVSKTSGSFPKPNPAVQTRLVCTNMTEAVVAARDDGIYADADGRPVQVIRLLDINKSVWKEPRSGNNMEIVVPHEQILVNNVNTY